MEKAMNYTPEMTAKLVSDYNSGMSVEEIAKEVNKSVRSVVAKLTREGVYKKKEYVPKLGLGQRPVTKEQLAIKIGELVGMSQNDTSSLVKCSKTALQVLLAKLQ